MSGIVDNQECVRAIVFVNEVAQKLPKLLQRFWTFETFSCNTEAITIRKSGLQLIYLY
jgi:hypothetical protein